MSKRRGMINGGNMMTIFAMLVGMLAFAGLIYPVNNLYGLDYEVHLNIRDAPVEPGDAFALEVNFWDQDSSFQAEEFSIQIWYPDTAVTPAYAIPGELLENCGWSFQVEYPSSGLIKFHGKAPEGANDECLLHGAAGPLAIVYMQFANDPSYWCRIFKFRFYWDSCDDNTFVGHGGNAIFLVNRVIEPVTGTPYPPEDSLPTFQGAPDLCLNDSTAEAIIVRNTNFMEGALFSTCGPDLMRGDLNLNFVPYELADYSIYVNYFLYGPDVFTVDSNIQMYLTDINNNGIILMPDDIVYMNRIMIGDALPYEKGYDFPYRDTADFTQDLIEKKVSLTYPDSLGAISFTFRGTIVPQPININDLQMEYSQVDGKTHVMIYPYGQDRIMYAGDLFSYTGYGILSWIDAGDYEGLVPFVGDIAINGEVPLCGDADGDGTLNITDAVRIINCVFMGGICPSLVQGDANCNGTIDIGDAVRVIFYIFMNGYSPCDTNGDGDRDC